MQRLPISVIMPARNVAEYIGEALRSLFGQTCPPSEIIICFDRCEDETEQAAKEAVATYWQYAPETRVVYTHTTEDRCGRSWARNLAIKQATMPYIAPFDSDDVLHPRLLHNLLQVLRMQQEVCGPKQFVYPAVTFFGNAFGHRAWKWNTEELFTLRARAISFFIAPWEVFSHILYDPSFDYAEDIDLLLQMHEQGWTGHLHSTSSSYQYRIKDIRPGTWGDQQFEMDLKRRLVLKHRVLAEQTLGADHVRNLLAGSSEQVSGSSGS